MRPGAPSRAAERRAGCDVTQFGPLGLVVLGRCAPSDFLGTDALGGLLFGVVALATLGVSILDDAMVMRRARGSLR